MPDTYLHFVIAYGSFWVILFGFVALLQWRIGRLEKLMNVKESTKT